MIIARVFELEKPGVRVRKGRVLLGGPFGRTVDIAVSGVGETFWSRWFGQRLYRLEVHERGFAACTGEEEATHALVFVDPSVDFLFSIDPTVRLPEAVQVLWEGNGGAKLLLAPQGSEFSVTVEGVWASTGSGLNHNVGVPVFIRRTLFYAVGEGGRVYQSQ